MNAKFSLAGLVVFLVILTAFFFLKGTGSTEQNPEQKTNSPTSFKKSDGIPEEPTSKSLSEKTEAPSTEPRRKTQSATKENRETAKKDTANAVQSLRILAEETLVAGINPSLIADSALDIMENASPDTASLTGSMMPGALQYPLQGLPDGWKGAFLIRKRSDSGIRTFDAIVFLPFKPVLWIQQAPREGARFALTASVDADWNLKHHSVFTEFPVDGVHAREKGMEPSKTKFDMGIGYQNAIDGKIYVHKIVNQGKNYLDSSLLLGPQNLSAALKDRLLEQIQDWAKQVRPKEFQ